MPDEQRPSRFFTESPKEKKSRIRRVLSRLRSEFPDADCALTHSNPVQLLVATILSAQCTDERVNKVTPVLFDTFPDAESLANASREDLIDIIRSTGFFRNKADNIRNSAKAIIERHDGKVPSTMEELVDLPGVGRKTANVVLGNAFGIPGFPVDTHVRRVANLLEFTNSDNPDAIEQHLCEIVPKKDWTEASHLFILHGRNTCIARRPRCAECEIERLCPSSTAAAGAPE